MAKRVRSGNPLRIVAYIRRSTGKQALTPAAQRAAIEAYAAKVGATVVAWHVDTLCGDTPLVERPVFAAALASLTEHGAGVLLVAKRDRMARDVYSMLVAELGAIERGARLLSAEGEGSDAADPLERRMRDLFAEAELRKIRERTRAALAVKRARGEKTGGDAPYGYRAEADARGVLCLVEEPAEQAVIARARALRADDRSYAWIAARLVAENLLPRSGGQWFESQVRAMLVRAEAA